MSKQLNLAPAGTHVKEASEAGGADAVGLVLAVRSEKGLTLLRERYKAFCIAEGKKLSKGHREDPEAARLRRARRDAAHQWSAALADARAATAEKQRLLALAAQGRGSDRATVEAIAEATRAEEAALARVEAADQIGRQITPQLKAAEDRELSDGRVNASKSLTAWLSYIKGQLDAELASLVEEVGQERLEKIALLTLAQNAATNGGLSYLKVSGLL